MKKTQRRCADCDSTIRKSKSYNIDDSGAFVCNKCVALRKRQARKGK